MRRFVLPTSVLLVAVLGATVAAGPPSAASPTLSTAAEPADSYRVQLGFPASAPPVSAQQASTTLEAFGVVLGEDEQRELEAREAAFAQLFAAARALPLDMRGGEWLDHASSSVVLAVTDADSVDAGALRSAMDEPARLRIVQVQFSLVELERAQTRVDDQIVSLEDSAGIDITGTSRDVVGNRVIVRVATEVDEARSAIASQFPPGMIAVVPGEPGQLTASGDKVGYQNSPPFRGGQDITRVDAAGGYISRCTSAFVGYRTEYVAGIAQYSYFVLTAGHCGPNNSIFTQGFPAGTPMGQMTNSTFNLRETTGDAGAISISGAARSNQVLQSYDRASGVAVTSSITTREVSGAATDQVGQRSCNYGTTTAIQTTTCGNITSVAETVDFPLANQHGRYLVRNMRCGGYTSQGGDSGGTVSNGSLGKGVVVGRGNGCNGLYSHVTDALRAAGLSNIRTLSNSATP